MYLDPNSNPPILLNDKVCAVDCVDDLKFDSLKCEFSDVFKKELGCMKRYQHKILLKKFSIPVACKVRNVPLAIREDYGKGDS